MPNVLIVDDENFVVKSLVSSINWDSLKLHVSTTCTNGVDALDYIEHHPIDIVITDIRMPGFTGLDLCSSLHTKYPHIKIILISGYADFAYAQKAIKYNVIGYCVNPLDYY
ncbi:MAG: response regulator [Niameybacter sp.]